MKKNLTTIAAILLLAGSLFAQDSQGPGNKGATLPKNGLAVLPPEKLPPNKPAGGGHDHSFCGYSGQYQKDINNPATRAASYQKFNAQKNNFVLGPAVMTCGRFEFFFDDINLGTGMGFDDPVNGMAFRQCVCDVANYIQTVFDIPAGDGTPIEVIFNQSWTPSNLPPNPNVLATGGSYYSTPAFLSGTAGFYGGNTFEHYTTGFDPDPGNIDGAITVNFMVPYRLCNLPRSCGAFDFYSIMLHEFSHVLGWASAVTNTPSIRSIYWPNDQYSKYDEFFLHYGSVDPTAPPLIKIVTNAATPLINTGLPTNALTGGALWVYGHKQDHTTLNQNVPSFTNMSYAMGSGPPNTSSHLAEYQVAFFEHASQAPGFVQDYVMGPMFYNNQVRDVWSEQELRMLNTMGYTFTPSFVASYPHVPVNRHPYTTKTIFIPSWLNVGAGTTYGTGEVDINTFTPPDRVITNCSTAVFNLATDPLLIDADGDPIRIFPGSLYNIRGTSIGGINHNCLTTSSPPAGDVITYTPRPDFVGRAQFGFYTYDGKEKGEFMVYTIDVTGCNPCGPNLVITKDFEEGMEIKTLSNPLPDNCGQHHYRNQKYPPYGTFADGMVFNNGGQLLTNQSNGCDPNEGNFGTYGFNPGNPGTPTFPAIPGTQRFYWPTEANSYFRLCSSPQNCTRYILEFDFYCNIPITVTAGFTNNPQSSASAIALINSVSKSVPSGTGWQHIVVPINYCSTTICDYLVFQFAGTSWNNFNFFIDNLDLHVDPTPPVFSVGINPATANICPGGNITLSAAPVNPMCNVTYSWSPGSSTASSINVSPIATTTYTLNASDGCSNASATKTVTVNPLPTITASASPSAVCSLSPTSTLTATGGSTYVWNPGSIPGNPVVVSPVVTTTYTVTGTSAAGCSNTATTTVTYFNCTPCTSCTPVSGTIGTGTYATNSFCVPANLTISGAVTITGAEFQLSPGVVITILPGASLTINSSHFYACTSMWQGIVVQNGGTLSIQSSMIEDAKVAVDVTGNTQTTTVLNIAQSTFNRNYIGININNYTQAITTYPFVINNCVFTCRNIPFLPNTLIFPSAATIGAIASNPGAPLSNPYINNATYLQTGAAAELKVPYLGTKSFIGVKLTDVGSTLNPSSSFPTFYEFTLGGPFGGNIIDNHYTGVDLYNSNFLSVGNTYQNTLTYGSNGSLGGIGINADSDPNNHNRLSVLPSSPGSDINRFVDCSRAIWSYNQIEHDIRECDFRSTQQVTAPVVLTNNPGNYGVYINSNRYRVYQVNNNSFYNIENGITITATTGPMNLQGVPAGTTQFAGEIFANYNTIRPQLVGNPVTTEFVSNGIVLNYSPVGALALATLNSSTPFAYVDFNNITDAYRGINCVAWTQHDLYVRFNIITLVNDPYNGSGNPVQYGINVTECIPVNSNYVWANTVTGFGFGFINPDAYGIRMIRNINSTVICNITDNITYGIAFVDKNLWTIFERNEMSNNDYGFSLINNGEIGQQGTPSNPQDNQWTGIWGSAQYKTATFFSTATNSIFYIRTNAVSPYNPDGSTFTNLAVNVDDYTIVPGATLIVSSSAPSPQICMMLGKNGQTTGIETKKGFDAALFPNPGHSHFNIETTGLGEGDIDVVISDVTGRIVYRNMLHVTNGVTQLNLDATTGVYLCEIHNKLTNETIVKKLIVRK